MSLGKVPYLKVFYDAILVFWARQKLANSGEIEDSKDNGNAYFLVKSN